ncbi:cytochrome P450 [Microbacterium sp. Clip185]|uniref:cytochrome P450 n=1 Tax=Microbacterium sp. Clip185 TaxID=3025663 RepID=UPI002365CB91|nr:cytochrome P450 [Microbacterium sp. Clip185]WDG18396.1 cytochrome P450 [Microbacterium sp. Clip185]
MTTTTTRPESDVDLFTDEVLSDPYSTLDRLREQAPAVYLSRLDMWLICRYEPARRVLGDWESFSSAQGVGMTEQFNHAWSAALICQDPPTQTEQRAIFTENLSTRALRPLQATIDVRAEELVDELVSRGRFDAVADLAHDLPINVIMDLIGWPPSRRERLIPMATAWFETIGPDNERNRSSWPVVGELFEYLNQAIDQDDLTPGSFGRHLLDVHRAGHLPREAAVGLLAGYVVAAFDTTINAIASAVWLFAREPEQWDALRAAPSLVASAFNEVIRVESPIQYFTRVATREVDVDGVTIPEGARVLISYGGANRDARHFAEPARFDIARNAVDHLAFSFGNHACAGQNLARLEGHAVLRALIPRVARFEFDGTPERALNNAGRGFAHLPVRVTPA